MKAAIKRIHLKEQLKAKRTSQCQTSIKMSRMGSHEGTITENDLGLKLFRLFDAMGLLFGIYMRGIILVPKQFCA